MKRLSDSTLLRMTKRELLEQLRCAEHNKDVAEFMLSQQAENVKDWIPVVRCGECRHSYESLPGYICSFGICADCEVPGDFYCCYGAKE